MLVRYWEEHAKDIASSDTAFGALRLWNEYWGEAFVSELLPKRQKDFLKWLKDKGYKNSYVSRVVGVGRAALRYAWQNQVITSVPYIFNEMDRSDTVKAYKLSKQEMATLIKAAYALRPHLYMFIMVSLNTLARPDAVLDLRPEGQADYEHRIVNMNPPGRKQTKKRRPKLPMTDAFMAVTKDGPQAYRFDGTDLRKTEPVTGQTRYVNWYGKPIGEIYLGFKRLVTVAGLDSRISPYSLRHTMAKELRARGVPWEEIEGFLGHRIPGTTEEYAEFDPQYLSAGRAAVDAYMAELAELGVPIACPPAQTAFYKTLEKEGS